MPMFLPFDSSKIADRGRREISGVGVSGRRRNGSVWNGVELVVGEGEQRPSRETAGRRAAILVGNVARRRRRGRRLHGLPQPVPEPDQSPITVPPGAGQAQRGGGQERRQVVAQRGEIGASSADVADGADSDEDGV